MFASARALTYRLALCVVAAALVVAGLAVPVGAQAARTLYVSGAGNDSAGGSSPADAWRSLGHAARELRAGDTLWVLDGTYGRFTVDADGRSDAWIRIVAHPGAQPVIDAGSGTGIRLEGASFVEIWGLEVRGDADRATNPNGVGMLVTGNSHHLRFVQNDIHHFGAGGLIAYRGGDHLEMYHNRIHHNAYWNPDQHSAISLLGLRNDGWGNDLNGYSNYIIGNVVYSNEVKVPTTRYGEGLRVTDGNCFIMDVGAGERYRGRTLFGSNLCVGNGGRGTQVYRAAAVDVVNNTYYHNMRSPDVAVRGAEVMSFQSHDARFANNIVVSLGDVVPMAAHSTTAAVHDRNLTVGRRSPDVDGAQHLPRAQGLFEQPNWDEVDASGFAPTSTSPAVDGGDDRWLNGLPVDVNGAPRRAGGAVDIGAVERGASGAWFYARSVAGPGSNPDDGRPAGAIRPSDPPNTAARRDAVGRLYAAAFLRTPDDRGLAYWTGIDGNMILISDAFVVSDEFVARYGRLDDRGFVDRVYRNVLGRAPDPSGFAFWTEQMALGMSRAEVLFHFSDSAEYRRS